MSTVNEKMTALADAIREKAGVTTPLSLDSMIQTVNNLEIGQEEIETRDQICIYRYANYQKDFQTYMGIDNKFYTYDGKTIAPNKGIWITADSLPSSKSEEIIYTNNQTFNCFGYSFKFSQQDGISIAHDYNNFVSLIPCSVSTETMVEVLVYDNGFIAKMFHSGEVEVVEYYEDILVTWESVLINTN